MKFVRGIIIKMSGLSIKKENGVFEVENCWEKDCSVYKLKKDGSRIKHGLDIFSYKKMEQYGEIITLSQVPAAISEINKQLKDRKENELVISFESTTNKEYTNKTYIRVVEPIHTTSSIYAVPRNSVFQLSVNEKWNSVTWQRVGKRGELLSNYNGENMMTWSNKNMDRLFAEGYIEVVERVETVRKDMEQIEEVKEEVIEPTQETTVIVETPAIENVEVTETIEEVNEINQTTENEITFQTGTGLKGNGIEITFTSKPSEEVRNLIKSNGYRWAGKQRPNVWWAILNAETLAIAEQLTNKQENNSTTEPVNYPEIDIDDNETYTIDQRIQNAEHDANWIFRSTKRDHNKELYNLFTSYTNNVKALIETTDNEYYIYKLKQGLQRFKKKYHETYIKWLSHKGNNPSWAVTGRGNLNVSRYNKAMDRQGNLLNELAALSKEFDQYMNKYRNKIKNDKQEAYKQQRDNVEVNINFTIETKEFTYMGYNEKKRVHSYNEYFICKLWGCFRLFYKGKELNINLKTTDNLETAKKTLTLYIQQQEQKAS
jgi:hypothetical protein